jgi:hypothetical protein
MKIGAALKYSWPLSSLLSHAGAEATAASELGRRTRRLLHGTSEEPRLVLASVPCMPQRTTTTLDRVGTISETS